MTAVEQARLDTVVVKGGDQVFLATIEQAMRRALEAALTPQRG